MIGQDGALGRSHPRRWDVPLLWVVCLVLLVFGLTRPIVTLSSLGQTSSATFSVLTGISDLWSSGHRFLAFIIFTTSFVFPAVKLVCLGVVWAFRLLPGLRMRLLEGLMLLGKWSMLDVFVVAGLLGVLELGWLSDASAHPGIYLYAASILLTMFLIHLVARLARAELEKVVPRGLPVLTGIPVELPALVLLVIGYELPLMSVDKWVFWQKDYSILSGTLELFRSGSYVMASFLAFFVVLAPTTRLLGYCALRFVRRSGKSHVRLISLVRSLNRWTMGEVFALGLLVVLVKVGGHVNVTFGPGLWCFLAGTFLSLFPAWPVRRTSTERRRS